MTDLPQTPSRECVCEGEFIWACGPECDCYHHTDGGPWSDNPTDPPEQDFSKGERGKYHKRVTDQPQTPDQCSTVISRETHPTWPFGPMQCTAPEGHGGKHGGGSVEWRGGRAIRRCLDHEPEFHATQEEQLACIRGSRP